MGLEGELNIAKALIYLVVGIDDRANYGIQGCGIGGYYGAVTAHNLNVVEHAGHFAVKIQLEALRSDTYKDLLILYACNIQNSLIVYIELAVSNLALKYVDGRCTQELGYEQVYRAVIYVLRSANLLNYAQLHNYNHVGDGHCLFLVVGYENGGNLGFSLNSSDFFSGLQTESCIKVGKRLVQKKYTGHLYQSSCDGNSLLLTALKLVGLSVH